MVAAATLLTTNLPPVVVEASRLHKTTLEMPAHVETLSRSQIDRSTASDLPQLLEHHAGGVYVRKLGDNPALQQLSMRGTGVNSFGRVGIVVDGERLNNPDMDYPDLARIALSGVDHVEILHGPQTVLHGDSASAGLVNVVTAAQDYENRTVLGAHVGSWGAAGLDFSARGGDEAARLNWNAYGSYDRSDGYRDHGDHSVWNAGGGVRQETEGGAYLDVSAFWSRAHYGTPGPLPAITFHADPEDAATPDDWYDRTSYGLKAAAGMRFSEENRLDVTFTASHRTWSAISYATKNDSNLYAYRLTPRFTSEAALFGLDNEFQAGLDFGFNRIDGAHQGPGTKVNYSRLSSALYLHDELFVTETLSLFAGVRGERFDSRIEQPLRRFKTPVAFTRVAAEAGVNFRPCEELKLYAKWSRFYRAPFADEMFTYNSWYVPNYDLRPEVGNSLDAGVEWHPDSEWTLAADAYASRTDDEIIYGGFGGLAAKNVNLPWAVQRFGADLSLGWERERTGWASAKFSYVHATLAGGPFDHHRVPMVPREQLNLNAGWYVLRDVSVFGGYRFVGEQPTEADFSKSYPWLGGVSVFRAGARYEPSAIEGLTLTLAIDNLFDRNYADYATYGYYYPAPGRSLTFSVRYEF